MSRPLQDSGFLDGAFESQNAALGSLSRLLYDELVKSILRIVEKLDLSVQKVTTGEEVGPRSVFLTLIQKRVVRCKQSFFFNISSNVVDLVFRSVSVG